MWFNFLLVLFYEEERSVQSFDQAVEYFKKNPSIGITVNKVFKVMSNGTDATGLIKSCEHLLFLHSDFLNVFL